MSEMNTKIYASQDWVGDYVNENTVKSWNQLEDKPFYSISGEEEYLAEISPIYDESEQMYMIMNELIQSFVVGDTYVVNWNGTEYTCTSQDLSALESGVSGLGDCSLWAEMDPNLTGNGEPFAIIAFPGQGLAMISMDGLTTLTISIKHISEIVYKLDPKYIPDRYAKSEDVANIQSNMVSVQNDVASVQTAVTTAQSTADTAVTNAATAQNTANTAVTNASKAQTTANQAVTNAATAQSTADEAVTNAATAQSTADEAVTKAETAQSTADGKMNATDPVGTGSFSMNRHPTAIIGTNSHAEGYYATASGEHSHAEGYVTTASGKESHAEGYVTTASGSISHAEGSYATASGNLSHAEGCHATASGYNSHAEGYYTIAASGNQHVQGKFNISDNVSKYAHIVGNGTSDDERSNAHTVDWDGIGWFQGGLQAGGNAQDDGAKNVLLEGDAIPVPEAAEVGQVLVVKAVDENGKPTEWECVTLNFTVDEDGVLST